MTNKYYAKTAKLIILKKIRIAATMPTSALLLVVLKNIRHVRLYCNTNALYERTRQMF